LLQLKRQGWHGCCFGTTSQTSFSQFDQLKLQMFLVEPEISVDSLDRDRLVGASIDVPASGSHWNAKALSVEGWAVGRESAVNFVEIVGPAGCLRRWPLTVERPDVERHFNALKSSRLSGFRGTLDVSDAALEDVHVRAVLQNGVTARIGNIRLGRFWQSAAHPAEQGVVSIIIPCFNQAHFLSAAIESAQSQTYEKVEIVVIDDGSTDNTEEVVSRYRGVRYIRQQNEGLSGARNTGIRRSNGEFVVFLDADDRLRPSAAKRAVEVLDAHPECAFVSGEYCDIGVDGARIHEWLRPPIPGNHYLALLRSNYITCPAAVTYRRGVFQAVGGFDRRLNVCEDYDLYLRIARLFPVCAHGEVAAEYRRYSASMSDNPARMLVGALSVLKRQRPFIREDSRRAEAFAEGLAHWRSRYGAPLAAQTRKNLARWETRWEGLAGFGVLLRNAPKELRTIMRPTV
jgi:hypothetical protein